MAYTIRFNGRNEVMLDRARARVRSEGWAGTPGFKEWASINYRARLRTGVAGNITSITFQSDQDMMMFQLTFG